MKTEMKTIPDKNAFDQLESSSQGLESGKFIKIEVPHFIDLESRVALLEKILVSKNKPSSPYATICETKEYLKCSYSTVRRLIDRGFLKKNLDSRHILILWNSIFAYVGTTASS